MTDVLISAVCMASARNMPICSGIDHDIHQPASDGHGDQKRRPVEPSVHVPALRLLANGLRKAVVVERGGELRLPALQVERGVHYAQVGTLGRAHREGSPVRGGVASRLHWQRNGAVVIGTPTVAPEGVGGINNPTWQAPATWVDVKGLNVHDSIRR
jgi:hypothetical protein